MAAGKKTSYLFVTACMELVKLFKKILGAENLSDIAKSPSLYMYVCLLPIRSRRGKISSLNNRVTGVMACCADVYEGSTVVPHSV